MKNQIKAIQNHFVSMIINQQYEVVEIDPNIIKISIDSMVFVFLYDKKRNWADQYSHAQSFMMLEFTTVELENIQNLLIQDVKDYEATIVLEAEKKQYEALKLKFEK